MSVLLPYPTAAETSIGVVKFGFLDEQPCFLSSSTSAAEKDRLCGKDAISFTNQSEKKNKAENILDMGVTFLCRI